MSFRNSLKLFAPFAFIVFVFGSVALAQPPGRPGQGGPPRGERPPQDGRQPFGRPPDDGRPRKGQPPPQGQGQKPPPASFLSAEMQLGRIIKSSPFFAQAIIENTQVLANGARISHKDTGTVYRDGEGRLRRDVKLNRVGPFALDGEELTMVFINDPVSGEHIAMNPRDRVANKMKLPPPDDNVRDMNPKPPNAVDAKTESLGKKTIEGVEAEGTRTTFTIPVGEIGNDQPLYIISERWYSNDLQVLVMSKHSDPRFGETTYRLININRSEPQRSLFSVPSDYRVENKPPKQRPPLNSRPE